MKRPYIFPLAENLQSSPSKRRPHSCRGLNPVWEISRDWSLREIKVAAGFNQKWYAYHISHFSQYHSSLIKKELHRLSSPPRRTRAPPVLCAHNVPCRRMLCATPGLCSGSAGLHLLYRLEALLLSDHPCLTTCAALLHSPIRRAARAQRLSGSLRASSGLQRPCLLLEHRYLFLAPGCPLPILKHPVLMW